MTTNLNANDNSSIPSVLQRIVATKREEVIAAKTRQSLDAIKAKVAEDKQPRRGFAKALRATGINKDGSNDNAIGIIAEIKKASPSKGIINHNFSPALFAQQYEQAGATCLSVLTDREYFQGDDTYLLQAYNAASLPVLRKDFMIDIYQIYESYLLGADCILLIMACLDDDTVQELHTLSIKLGMDVLIEVHTAGELERALKLPYSEHNIYGINNRDLNTFEVDLQNTLDLKDTLLAALATDSSADDGSPLVVTESGIHSSADIQLMLDNDIQHFLIGEQFMKTDHPGQALQTLLASVSSQA